MKLITAANRTATGFGRPEISRISNPRREIVAGAAVAGLFFLTFGVWAGYARLDAAAHAPGSLIVSGQRQAVQHRDGGTVGSILVHEGDHVTRGQVLVRLSAPEIEAQNRSLLGQVIRLLAQRARLQAELNETVRIETPAEFASWPEADAEEVEQAMVLQVSEMKERAAVLATQTNALLEKKRQLARQQEGYQLQAKAASDQISLVNEQMSAIGPLVDKRLETKSHLRELQRTIAQLEGQMGQFEANAAEAGSAASEMEVRIAGARREFREALVGDLREVESKLADLLPKLAAARTERANLDIRAPATGSVVGLSVFTPGGVITAGQRLMDIVPEFQPLVVEARFSPDEADDLETGQPSIVRLTGIHDRTQPELHGTLTRFSADSMVDEKTGQRYFAGEVTIPRDQLEMLARVRGGDPILRPGMPAEVLVPLRRRTLLEYLVEPLVASFWVSFREH